MIETFSSKTTHEALALSIHIWMKAQYHFDVSSARNVVEHRSERSITIANEKPWRTIERGVAKLLGSPLAWDDRSLRGRRPLARRASR
tara:strand:- start:2317 stop:2580 length:264 start_codon:yes stop_codon:yes gene_type:complete